MARLKTAISEKSCNKFIKIRTRHTAMPFSKSFPRTTDKSVYPRWEEIFLSESEEQEQEKLCREDNIRLMKECITDAKKAVSSENMKSYQNELISIAIALFEKRASHSVYWKERKAKDKFDAAGKKV